MSWYSGPIGRPREVLGVSSAGRITRRSPDEGESGKEAM